MIRVFAIAAVILPLLSLPGQADVDKATNAATPVPLDAPRPYHLSPNTQRSIARTRETVAKRHDSAWATRARRDIHTERGAVLSKPPSAASNRAGG